MCQLSWNGDRKDSGGGLGAPRVAGVRTGVASGVEKVGPTDVFGGLGGSVVGGTRTMASKAFLVGSACSPNGRVSSSKTSGGGDGCASSSVSEPVVRGEAGGSIDCTV